MSKTVIKDNLGLGTDFSIVDPRRPYDKLHVFEGNPHGVPSLVTIKNHETGEVVFQGRNKTMLAGSEFMALNMFYLPSDGYITPTYNNMIGAGLSATGLENTVVTDEPENRYCVQLWCMGTSGCNRESALKYEVVNKWWIDPVDLVPFQYVRETRDLDAVQRAMYFGRKHWTDSGFVAYYFKKFDSDPVLTRQLEDGTAIDSNIYSDRSELGAQVIVTNSLTVTKDDGRDYFINTTGINDGRFNCIELCLAWYKVINGYSYFQDIRPATRINFPNKYLSDLGASWDIIYQLFF